MPYLKRFAVKNSKRVPRSLNEQPFLSSLAVFTALSLTKSLHLCLYNKEIQKMPFDARLNRFRYKYLKTMCRPLLYIHQIACIPFSFRSAIESNNSIKLNVYN